MPQADLDQRADKVTDHVVQERIRPNRDGEKSISLSDR
jgi:hypothetical protein